MNPRWTLFAMLAAVVNVVTLLGVGAAIVWRLAVIQTHVELLRSAQATYVTKAELRAELAELRNTLERGKP